MTRVLVAWGSKYQGSEGIAAIIGDVLQRHGVEVVLQPASAVHDVQGYDAAVIGSGLYANRWLRSAWHLVTHNIAALRRMPVWLFSSGPLDDSADRVNIPPTNEVAVLMERVGAIGHVTFGGRLPADAKGFPAEAMAKTRAGDWRNPDRVRSWATGIARALPTARPGEARDPPERSVRRLLAHGVAGWALCGALMGILLQTVPTAIAVAIHAAAAPLIFAAIAWNYFRARGAHQPLSVALAFTAIVAILDAGVVAALVLKSFAMFASVAGTWLPFPLIFVATWATGTVMAMMPPPARGAAATS